MSASTFSCCLPRRSFLPGVRFPICRLADARRVFFFLVPARTARFAAGRRFAFVARFAFRGARRARLTAARFFVVFFFFFFAFAIRLFTQKKMTREYLLP